MHPQAAGVAVTRKPNAPASRRARPTRSQERERRDMGGRITENTGTATRGAQAPRLGRQSAPLPDEALEVDQRVALVDDASPLGEAAPGIESAGTGFRVEGVEANGVGGPRPCNGDG